MERQVIVKALMHWAYERHQCSECGQTPPLIGVKFGLCSHMPEAVPPDISPEEEDLLMDEFCQRESDAQARGEFHLEGPCWLCGGCAVEMIRRVDKACNINPSTPSLTNLFMDEDEHGFVAWVFTAEPGPMGEHHHIQLSGGGWPGPAEVLAVARASGPNPGPLVEVD